MVSLNWFNYPMLRLIKCKVMIKCKVTFLLLSCCSSSICRSLSGSSSSDCKTKMKRLNTQNKSISPIGNWDQDLKNWKQNRSISPLEGWGLSTQTSGPGSRLSTSAPPSSSSPGSSTFRKGHLFSSNLLVEFRLQKGISLNSSVHSPLEIFQAEDVSVGEDFPRSINKKRICINGKQFTTWPRCFFLPSQGHHSAAPALAHTYKNDKETFLKANEDKVKFQFLVGRTCATCPWSPWSLPVQSPAH